MTRASKSEESEQNATDVDAAPRGRSAQKPQAGFNAQDRYAVGLAIFGPRFGSTMRSNSRRRRVALHRALDSTCGPNESNIGGEQSVSNEGHLREVRREIRVRCDERRSIMKGVISAVVLMLACAARVNDDPTNSALRGGRAR